MNNKNYDVIIVGAGPGGLYAALILVKSNPNIRIAIFEKGKPLNKRKCPIGSNGITSCIKCDNCSIMSGFGGAGAFSDGKFNITNDFGGELSQYIGELRTLIEMKQVDAINLQLSESARSVPTYSTKNSPLKKICLQNGLTLLDASVRHYGTDINYEILSSIYKVLRENKVDFYFSTTIEVINPLTDINQYWLTTDKGEVYKCNYCIVSAGRSGSKWIEKVCDNLDIPTTSNHIDLGVRVELPAEVFSHITDELYESKIVYRTRVYEDLVRTFCMNPRGSVVNENTNNIVTVNGHSFNSEELKTNNTNFALLVSKNFSEPFHDSIGYGESIAKLSNMLGNGAIIQRFGDLIRGRRSTPKKIDENTVRPTLDATPGDLSLVLPKRILDDIIEMIYALDKIAPGTANDDTLLYGVEVKFYNMKVSVDNTLQAKGYQNLYMIGDGSGITHSLSQAAASGIFVAKEILNKLKI